MGVFLAFLTITRPEGFIYSILFIATFYILDRQKENLFRALLPFIIVYIGLIMFRYQYYGEFFPNTVTAKVDIFDLFSKFQGIKYVTNFFIYTNFLYLAVIVYALFNFLNLTKTEKIVLIILISNIGFSIGVGGDYFPFYRFFIYVWPLFAYLSISQLMKIKLPIYVILIITITFCTNSVKLISDNILSRQILFGFNKYKLVDTEDRLIKIGKFFKNYDKNEKNTIATVAAGKIAYFSDHQVLDMLGLNDKVNATASENTNYENPNIVFTPGHTAGNVNYILEQKPKYIILNAYLTNCPDTLGTFRQPGGEEKLPIIYAIKNNQIFREHYNASYVKIDNEYFTYFVLDKE
jgi:hypothetical protein